VCETVNVELVLRDDWCMTDCGVVKSAAGQRQSSGASVQLACRRGQRR